MEMESSPPEKKLWYIVRTVYLLLRKGISKRKLMLDLHMMMKRGKIAGKAISNLMFHHYSTFSCRSNDVNLSFISPREYQFSCSNSPAYPFHLSKRKNPAHFAIKKEAVQKVIEMLNKEVEASPFNLPGFGRSPFARQLRITDSPFPLKETEEYNPQVDLAAEEFISKFYKELKLQKSRAALESPCYYTWGHWVLRQAASVSGEVKLWFFLPFFVSGFDVTVDINQITCNLWSGKIGRYIWWIT